MITRRRAAAGIASAALLAAGGRRVSALTPPGPEIPPRPPPPQRPGSELDRISPFIAPWLDLVCPHTGESWQGWFAGPEGARRGAALELDWLFRDWREQVSAHICERLHWALAAVAQRAVPAGGTGRITLLSGYRTPKTNAALPGAARDSMHMYGRAADIVADGLSAAETADLAERLEIGGTGIYPAAGFVHIDTGRRRRWRG